MASPGVVVIGETPSLASAVVELLQAGGVGVVAVRDLGEAEALAHQGRPPSRPLLITASNGHHCPTVERWKAGCLKDSELVVVGTRDPQLRSSAHLHIVPLPLVPTDLLELVRSLEPTAPAPARPRRRSARK
jgi:hypothetical protein